MASSSHETPPVGGELLLIPDLEPDGEVMVRPGGRRFK